MNITEIVDEATIRSKVPAINDLFSDTDETAQEFLGYANFMAAEIADEFNWNALQKDFNITTAGYDTEKLPCDFGSLITNYIYDRSRNEMIGIETNDEALAMIASKTVSQSMIKFRLRGDKIQFTYEIDEDRDLYLTYKKKNYVTTDEVEGTRFTSDDSEFQLDDELLIRGIVWKRSEGLGFADADRRLAEYQKRLNSLTSKDQGEMRGSMFGNPDRYSPKTTDATWNRVGR